MNWPSSERTDLDCRLICENVENEREVVGRIISISYIEFLTFKLDGLTEI